MNKKLILLDKDLKVTTSFDFFPPYTVGDNSTIIDSIGNMYMIEGYFLIVDANYDTSAINTQDVVNMKIEVILTNFKQDCENTICEGFQSATMNAFYEFSIKDQQNFNQKATDLLLKPTLDSVEWKTKDKGVLTHTRDQFITLLDEAGQHKEGYINNLWQIRQKFTTYTTLDQIDSIGTFKDEVAKLPQ